MALVVTTLQDQIEAIFNTNVPNATEQQTAQIKAMALALASAIDVYIKSGVVSGVCATPSGAGTIQGTIS